MSSLVNRVSRYFDDRPYAKYPCPTCKSGALVPDNSSFTVTEPQFSESGHRHYDWEPHWVVQRFTFSCVCDRKSCGEIAYVSGSGGLDQRYDEKFQSEYYSSFRIRSFFPAPEIIRIPNGVSNKVSSLLQKSFELYWVDVSAAANALRASLEALLDELKVPRTQKNNHEKTIHLALHQRLEIWSKTEKQFAELCFALKEVGNLGSHGETVREKHYFGAMEIYSHVLIQLFENDAKKMKELAERIRSEIKEKN